MEDFIIKYSWLVEAFLLCLVPLFLQWTFRDKSNILFSQYYKKYDSSLVHEPVETQGGCISVLVGKFSLFADGDWGIIATKKGLYVSEINFLSHSEFLVSWDQVSISVMKFKLLGFHLKKHIIYISTPEGKVMLREEFKNSFSGIMNFADENDIPLKKVDEKYSLFL